MSNIPDATIVTTTTHDDEVKQGIAATQTRVLQKVNLDRPAPWKTPAGGKKGSHCCQLMCGIVFVSFLVFHLGLVGQALISQNVSGDFDLQTLECSTPSDGWSYTVNYYGYELDDDLKDEKCECHKEAGHSRRLDHPEDDATYMDMFDLMAAHIYVPLVGMLMIFVASISWILLLRRFGRTIVVATLIFNVLSLIAIGVFFVTQTLTGLAIPLFVIAGITTVYCLVRREYVFQAGRVMEAASTGLSKNQAVVWYLIPVEITFIVYVFVLLEALAASAKIYDVRKEDCQLETRETELGHSLFAALWLAFYIHHVKVNVVSSTLAHWAFTGDGAANAPSSSLVARKALGWSFSKSWPLLSTTSLVSTIVEKMKQWCENKFNMFNPFLCLWIILLKCILHQIQVFGRFVVVLHSITGSTFYESAYDSYELLIKGGNLEQALSSNYFAEVTLGSIQYVLSLLLGAVMWAWIDTAEDLGSFTLDADFKTYFWILIIMWIILNKYPYVLLWLIVLLVGVFKDSTHGKSEALLFGMFCGGVGHIVFQFMTDIILDAVDAMIICFAIDKAHGMTTAETQSGRNESMKVMYTAIEGLIKKSESSKPSTVAPAPEAASEKV